MKCASELGDERPGSTLGARSKNAVVAGLCVIASIAFAFGMLEVVLRTTDVLSELDSPQPVYIPAHLEEAYQAMARRAFAFAEGNEFGFNDVNHERAKPDGTFRLAVVGDSFVWGGGIENELRWSKRLEALLAGRYGNVEVLHWGRPGWSTRDEYAFLEEHARTFAIDTIVLGWVTNDPDMGNSMRRDARSIRFLRITGLTVLFPEASKWVSDHIDALVHRYTDRGYSNWMSRLYLDTNLRDYEQLVGDLASFLRTSSIPVLVALTPHDAGAEVEGIYAKIIPILERQEIPYLDLLAEVRRAIGPVRQRDTWANPADPHPGPQLTEIYAREVMRAIRAACAAGEGVLVSCSFDPFSGPDAVHVAVAASDE